MPRLLGSTSSMISHSADFGGAGECAGGERGGEDVHVGDALFQTAFDVWKRCALHGSIFHYHFVGDFDFAGFADAADVVAS